MSAERKEADAEFAALLHLVPADYQVRVCEGGGPEELRASVAVSVTKMATKLAEYKDRARRWYLPDGSFVKLTEDEVIEKRKQAAKDLVELAATRAVLAKLKKQLDDAAEMSQLEPLSPAQYEKAHELGWDKSSWGTVDMFATHLIREALKAARDAAGGAS